MGMSSDDALTLKSHIDGVDAASREAEAEWGVERLPMLVDAELRAKFYRQEAKWRDALETAYSAPVLTRDMLEAVRASSAAMVRAYGALAAAASEAGHRPVRPEVWEIRLHDGTVGAFVQTNAEVAAARASGRYLQVFTLEEVANIIAALPPTLVKAHAVFEGAKFVAPRDRSWVRHGDPIPF